MIIDEILDTLNARIKYLENECQDAEYMRKQRLQAQIHEVKNTIYVIKQMYPKPKQIWLSGPNIAINWSDGVDTSATLANGDLWHLDAGVFLALLKRFISYGETKKLIKGIREENIVNGAYQRLRKYADIRAIYGEKIPGKEKSKK